MADKTIPPMSLPRALLFFGLPFLLVTGIFWFLIPLMDLMAVRLFITYLLALGAPMLLLFLLSLRFYRKEGHPWNRSAFCERFRLKPMNGIDWLCAFALAVFMVVTHSLLFFTSSWISEIIPQPKFLIRMFEDDPNYFMEFPIKGNWLVFFGMLLFVTVNILGKEFWWRGYILPRQELVHGKYTWLVHGLLWNLFQAFMPWHLLQLLPGALALAYVVQHRQNTSPAIVAHFAMNVPTLAQLLLRIT